MINVTIAGRLGKDAELKQAGNTQVCSFSVAADTGFGNNKQSHWFNCSIWGKQGEALAQYLKKGSQVTVIGEYSEREYQGKQYKELRVNQIELQGSKSDTSQNAGYPLQNNQNYQQPQDNSNPFIQNQPNDYAQNMANQAQANFGNGQAFNNQTTGNAPPPSQINDQDVPF